MKKIIKSLFCLMMFFGLVCLVTACDDNTTEPEDTDWEEDVLSLVEPSDESGVYTVTHVDGKATINVTKSSSEHEWASLKVNLANKDVSKANSLRFAIKGAGAILFKIESATKGAKEIELNLTSGLTAYEWYLKNQDEKDILAADDVNVYIFVLPGKAEGETTVEMSMLVFSEAEAMFNKLLSGHKPVVDGDNVYDGVSSTFDINANWVENDAKTYTFTEVDNGVKVDFNVSGWQFAKTPSSGAYGKFDYVTFKVTGSKGQSVLVKAEGGGVNKEYSIKFNGSEQTYSLDLTSYEDSAIEQAKVLIFANTGATGNGSFIIHECYFGLEDETNLGIVEGETANYAEVTNEGINTSNSFDLNNNKAYFWTDTVNANTNEVIYKVANESSPWEITWDRTANQNDIPLLLNVNGAFANFAKFNYGIDAPEGSKLRIELVNGQGVVLATSEGTGLGYEARIAGSIVFADAEINANDIKQVRIYVDADNTSAGTGKIVIHWLNIDQRVSFKGVPIAEITDYGKGNNLGLNESTTAWHDSGNGVYTLTNDTTPREFSYSKEATGDEWAYLVQYVNSYGLLGNFSKLSIGLEIATDVKFMIKVEGNGWNKESKDLVGTGECKEFVLDLSDKSVAERNSIHSIIIFIDYANSEAVSGTFKIHWAALQDYKNQNAAVLEYDGTSASFNVNKNWQSLDEGHYTINNENAPWEISYNHPAGHEYCFMMVEVTGDFSSITNIHAGIELEAGKQVMIKLEGDGFAKEITFDGTGECTQMKFTGLTADEIKKIKKVLICVEPGNAEANSGTVKIHWFAFDQK